MKNDDRNKNSFGTPVGPSSDNSQPATSVADVAKRALSAKDLVSASQQPQTNDATTTKLAAESRNKPGESVKPSQKSSDGPEEDIKADRRAELDKAWKKAQRKAAVKRVFNFKDFAKKKVSMHLWALILLVVVTIALLITTIIFSGVFGKSFTKDGGSSQRATVYKVCSDLVDDFNKITTKTMTSSSTEGTKEYVNLAIKASRREHSGDDATCQYMIFYGFMHQNNTEGMADALDKLQNLSDRGLYPSSDISSINSLKNLKAIAGVSGTSR